MRDWWSSGARLSLKSGSAAVAFDIHLEDVGVVHEAVDGGERHSGVPEYLMMPLILIGESLMLWLLTPITLFLGPLYGWLSASLAVDWLWLCSFFPMGGSDRFCVLQQI